MSTINRYRSAQQGFSLLETLVAVVVIAVGLLAVASLQSNLIGKSADNKAKAEAMAIAQARLDEFRNYTNVHDTRTDFDTQFADTGGSYINPFAVTGVNANFTRNELFAVAGNTKNINVQVTWNDRNGAAQNVIMSTSLGWQSPRAVGDLGDPPTGPAVASPTGRAKLGQGQLPTGAPTTPNGDGTDLYDDGSGDLKLVVGTDVVLTLEDACQSGGGSCIDFVTINGRIYIDTATQNNLTPGDVFVTATDATFCQRFYTDSNSNVVTVTNSTTSADITANGDYSFFDYRCYLGGGWHGNIGVLLSSGISQNDKFCQGDPTSGNAYQQPVISARRVYRGMLYQIDANTGSGKQEDTNGNIVYYSIGVADALELPDPNTSDSTHDFVIASLPPTATAGTNCVTQGVMVRADSYVSGNAGALFAGVPTDFVCLNPNYIDAYDSTVFGVDSSCPYNPADPPAASHILGGELTVTAGTGDLALVELIDVNTSDGPGNCIRFPFSQSGTTYTAKYNCLVYDWGTGWDGYIEANSTGTNTYCFDDGSDGGADQRINLSGVTAATTNTGKDFTCIVGNANLISGTVTSVNPGVKYLTGATISAGGGTCAVAADGLSYSCFTGIYGTTDWTGTITFATSGGNVCGVNVDATTGIATFTNEAPGIVSRDLYVANNAGSCP